MPTRDLSVKRIQSPGLKQLSSVNSLMHTHSEAVSLGVKLAEESSAAGSTRASVGTIMTGNNAGSVVFQQFFQSLNDFANVMDAFSTSDTYGKIMGTGLTHGIKRHNFSILFIKQLGYFLVISIVKISFVKTGH